MLKSDAKRAVLALLLLGLASGCSKAPSPAHDKPESAQVAMSGGKAEEHLGREPVAVPTPAEAEKSAEEVSRIVGKADVTVRGKPSCKIDFIYGGFEPEDLFWDGETCAKVTAMMVDQTDLERLGKWQRLDEFEKRHVNELPGGKVLYVEGAFTASIYPVGTTRLSYEVGVAD